MKKVFMIHGFEGEPNGGFRPWLMGKLAEVDVWACSLAMPSPEAPKKDEWVKEISRAVGEPDENIFLMGHSLGVPAILRYIESLPSGAKIGGALLISGPIKPLGRDNLDHFMEGAFRFEHIKEACKNFAVIHGDNDASVPFSHAEELSQNLNCKLISIPNGQHLNGSAGFRELPEALEALKEMIK